MMTDHNEEIVNAYYKVVLGSRRVITTRPEEEGAEARSREKALQENMLKKLQERVREEVTSKGKKLEGVGDRRLMTIHANVYKEIRGRGGSQFVYLYGNKPLHMGTLHLEGKEYE